MDTKYPQLTVNLETPGRPVVNIHCPVNRFITPREITQSVRALQVEYKRYLRHLRQQAYAKGLSDVKNTSVQRTV